MMRDKIGGYTSRAQVDAFLNRWIQQYVTGSDAAASIKAQRPLAEARIDVVEVPGKPGVYRAVAFMRPHFQLDEIGISMRLVAELPPPAA
jgi:type VI secretion system protein ImpC